MQLLYEVRMAHQFKVYQTFLMDTTSKNMSPNKELFGLHSLRQPVNETTSNGDTGSNPNWILPFLNS